MSMNILFIPASSLVLEMTDYDENQFKRALYLADNFSSVNEGDISIYVRKDISEKVFNDLKKSNYVRKENVKILNYDIFDKSLNLILKNDIWYENLNNIIKSNGYNCVYLINDEKTYKRINSKNINCFLESDIGCDLSQVELISLISNNINLKKNIDNAFEIRNNYIKPTVSNDISWQYIEKKKSEFNSIYIYPLLKDCLFDYEDLGFSDQYEHLDYILSKFNSDVGVLICEQYLFDQKIDSEKIKILKNKYVNLIYDINVTKIPGYIQSTLLHADAFICEHTYISIQAQIFGIPVINYNFVKESIENSNQFLENLTDISVFDDLLKNQLYLKNGFNNPLLFMKFINGELNEDFYKKNKILSISDFSDIRLVDSLINNKIEIFSQYLANINYRFSSNTLLKFIVDNDAISFDLFDTLVQRPFTEPHELFGYIEPIIKEKIGNAYLPFHFLRREAEHLARKDFEYSKEVTLDQIYEKLKKISGIPENQVELIKEIELNAEYNVISKKKGIIDAWKFCDKLNKPKSIISDIYLDEDFIISILKKNNISDYNFLFVSSKFEKMKHDGTLYPEYIDVIKKYNPNIRSLGHIGDNSHADCFQANNYNINSYLVSKSFDIFKETNLKDMFSDALNSTSPLTSSVIGLIANKFFSNPNTSFDKNSFTDASLYKFGYAILGPFALGFVQWVMRRLSFMKADKAIFLARDSYLPMCIYNNFLSKLNVDLPESQYLLCSRRSLVVPGFCNDINSVLENACLNFGNTTYSTYLDSRFSILISEIDKKIIKKYKMGSLGEAKISFPRDLAKVTSLVNDILPLIYKKSNNERELYLEYLEESDLLDQKNYAIIDIGYSGTMQRKLDAITGNKYHGLYMLTHNYVMHEFKNKIFEAWLSNFDDQRSAYSHPSNGFIPLLESLLSSDGGSLVNFSKVMNKLIPNFVFTNNEDERIRFIREVHRGAIDFSSDYIDAFGFTHGSIELSPIISSHPMMYFSKFPSMKDTQTFMGLALENLFAGYEFDIIIDPTQYLSSDGFLTHDLYTLLVDKSKWPEGARVALSKFLKPQNIASNIDDTSNIDDNSETNAVMKRSVSHNVYLSPLEKKLKKLEKNPEQFFVDSKVKLMRPIGKLFKPSPLGAFNRKIIRKIINQLQ